MKKKMMIRVEIKGHKKRRYQEEEYKDYCDGDYDETSDNDTDKMNKKTPI